MAPPPPTDDEATAKVRPDDAGTVFTKDPPAPPPSRDPSDPPAQRAFAGLLGMGAILGIVVALGVAAWLAFDLERAGGTSFWILAIAPTSLIAVLALLRAARDGELADVVRPEWGDATRGILSAALLLGGAVAFVHVIAPSGSPRESWTARIYLQLGDPGWLRSHMALVALVIVLAAASEEIVWRGLVTRLIAERFGSRFAWVWAALPYALAQVPTAWALRDPVAGLNPMLIVACLALGLVWGGMARWTRRLFPSVLSHAAFDWCVIMLFRLWGAGV